MIDSSGGRRRFEAITIALSLTTLIANSALTMKSIQINESATDIAQSQKAAQNEVIYSVRVESMGPISFKSDNTGGKEAAILVGMYNTGTAPLKGCLTYFEPAKEDLTPYIYWPSILEPGGVVWTIKGGENHESTVKFGLPAPSPASMYLLEVWFECSNPKIVTSSSFFRVDVLNEKMQFDHSIVRKEAIDDYEHYARYESDSGRAPGPRPTS